VAFDCNLDGIEPVTTGDKVSVWHSETGARANRGVCPKSRPVRSGRTRLISGQVSVAKVAWMELQQTTHSGGAHRSPARFGTRKRALARIAELSEKRPCPVRPDKADFRTRFSRAGGVSVAHEAGIDEGGGRSPAQFGRGLARIAELSEKRPCPVRPDKADFRTRFSRAGSVAR